MEAQDCIDDYTNRIVDAIRNGDKQALRMALSQPVPTENDLFKARDLSALKLEYIAYLSLYAYAASKGGVSTEDVYLISNEYFNAGQLSKSQYFILLQKLAARFTDITSGMRENSGHRFSPSCGICTEPHVRTNHRRFSGTSIRSEQKLSFNDLQKRMW